MIQRDKSESPVNCQIESSWIGDGIKKCLVFWSARITNAIDETSPIHIDGTFRLKRNFPKGNNFKPYQLLIISGNYKNKVKLWL